ncbi:MAG: hypothetical protein AAF327_08420 [Cyanobacteria bacterium P01_A01_bin.37]
MSRSTVSQIKHRQHGLQYSTIAGIALSLMIWVVGWAIAQPAYADFCRTINQHEICLLRVKRSAKNHWEYRASVRIDGEKTPVEIYDCRHHVRIRRDGSREQFQADGAGSLICELLGS